MLASIGGLDSACSESAGDFGETGDFGGGDWAVSSVGFSASAMFNNELDGRAR